MSIIEALTKLESAVKVAKEKQIARDQAAAALNKASQEYADSVSIVNDLKASVTESIGNIFPESNSRVRQS